MRCASEVSVGWLQRSWGQACLACLHWELVSWGGQPRTGVFAEATCTAGDLSSLQAYHDLLSFGNINGGAITVTHLVLAAAVLKLSPQCGSQRTKTRRAVLDS